MPRPGKNSVVRSLLKSIILNGVLPLVVYTLLKHSLSDTHAIMIAVLIPAVFNVVQFVVARNVDVLGCFLLVGVMLSLAAVLLGGNARLLLIRDAFTTGIMGILMLISLIFPRPLIYHFAKRFETDSTPEQHADFAEKWKSPRFRRTMYLMTTVWGCVLTLEAIVRCLLAFRLSTTAFLAVSPVIQYVMLGSTIAWTVYYARKMKKLAAANS